MFPFINFGTLIVSSVLFAYFYYLSVSPAALEKEIGIISYKRCAIYRVISSIFMTIAGINYILFYWFPLPLPIPRTFPWSWWVSAVIAIVIAIPSGWLMLRGVKDAGEETIRPKPEHTLYEGIYQRIRHPQAVGEFPFWWMLAFLAHSPFLVLFTFLYIPVWYYMCIWEENDLIIRYGQAYEEYRQKTGFWFPRRQTGE
jgi:protein-S-isoprenylcysteine O-methyltransferase Ste14